MMRLGEIEVGARSVDPSLPVVGHSDRMGGYHLVMGIVFSPDVEALAIAQVCSLVCSVGSTSQDSGWNAPYPSMHPV